MVQSMSSFLTSRRAVALSAVAALCAALVVVGAPPSPAWGTQISVATAEQYRSAIAALSADASAGPHVVTITESFTLTSGAEPEYTGNQDLVVRADFSDAVVVQQQAGANVRFLHFAPSVVASLTIENLTVENFDYGNIGGAVAGFFPDTGDLDIINSTFRNNYSESHGGAVYWDCEVSGCDVRIEGSTFDSNTADAAGGAVIVHDADATVVRSTFVDNVSTGRGGGMSSVWSGLGPVGGTLEVYSSEFVNNTAADGGGGAVATSGAFGSLNSHFTGNSSTYRGGAVRAESTASVSHSTFTDNEGRFGGALWSAELATIALSAFTGNSAQHGGAVHTLSDGVSVDLSSFVDNSASGDGGAIDAAEGGAYVTSSQSTFHRNTATGMGGAIAASGEVQLVFSTLSANEASDGAHVKVVALGSNFFSVASVLVDAQGDDSCSLPDSVAGGSLGYNFVDDSSCELTALGDQTGPAVPDHGLEPVGDNGGPTLTRLPAATSPLVDAVPISFCVLRDIDQRGLPRPVGAGCEIGAAELLVAEFSDVTPAHPFFFEIGWLSMSGVTGGFDDGTYRPGASVSRQAMAAFLYRTHGEPAFTPPAVASFSDVPTSHPFYKEIEWLVDEEITMGFADGTFKPGGSVTRQAMAAFLYRLDGATHEASLEPSFSDVPITHPFFTEIDWLAQSGVTGGFADGTFRPTANVTRQAMAAFLYRYALAP